jgi:hypothetical protein
MVPETQQPDEESYQATSIFQAFGGRHFPYSLVGQTRQRRRPSFVFAVPLCFRISNSSSVIHLELVRVAPIVAAAPEFEAALEWFAFHRLPNFRTAFKFDHALVDALDPWRSTKLLEPEVQPVNQGSNLNERVPHTKTPERLSSVSLPGTGQMS